MGLVTLERHGTVGYNTIQIIVTRLTTAMRRLSYYLNGSGLVVVILAAARAHKLVWLAQFEALDEVTLAGPDNDWTTSFFANMFFWDILGKFRNEFWTTHG